MSYAKKFVKSQGQACKIERYVLEEIEDDNSEGLGEDEGLEEPIDEGEGNGEGDGDTGEPEEPKKIYAPYDTWISIRRTTRASRELGIRAGYWDGLIPIESKLLSGEIITVTDDYTTTQYLVQHANYDPQSRQIAFFCAKCNVIMSHMRYVEDVDENFNPNNEWKTLNADVFCYGEIVNQKVRQEIPGLLEGTIYIFQVPKVLGIKELDRIRYNDKNYQVVSIDDIGLSGVYQIQLQKDFRPDD